MFIKNLVFILIFAFACPAINAQTPSAETTPSVELTPKIAYITVEGMACQEGCADAIAKNLEEKNGVESVEVSYANGKAIIKFDDTQITLEEIENTITSTKVKDYVYTVKNTILKNKIIK